MRILCLQLARLGDILNTRPVLNAILRSFPNAQIDLLVRERYSSATLGIDSRIRVKVFPTAFFLTGASELDFKKSVNDINEFLVNLKGERYDTIINWSFSALSSYIVSAVSESNEGVDLRGYSRYSDKSLRLCDPVSSYFFSQVGIGRSNRLHLIDLFAGVAGVQLEPSDWISGTTKKPRSGVIIHVGASEEHKRVPASHFRLIIRRLLDETEHNVTLIGSEDERPLSEQIDTTSDRVHNLVGQTTFPSLFQIIGEASLLIGADSSPIHIGTLTGTPTVNISMGGVNFWETGPKAPYSRILRLRDKEEDIWQRVVRESLNVLNLSSPTDAEVYVDSDRQYVSLYESELPLDAQLLDWLYFDGKAPSLPIEYALLLQRFSELGQLGLEQVFEIERHSSNPVAIQILEQVDKLIHALSAINPVTSVFARYIEMRRAEIGPGSLAEVLQRTRSVYDDICILSNKLKSNQSPLTVEGP